VIVLIKVLIVMFYYLLVVFHGEACSLLFKPLRGCYETVTMCVCVGLDGVVS
jgi:hypothetical protein